MQYESDIKQNEEEKKFYVKQEANTIDVIKNGNWFCWNKRRKNDAKKKFTVKRSFRNFRLIMKLVFMKGCTQERKKWIQIFRRRKKNKFAF